MHGCANDYIYVNCLDGMDFDPNKLSEAMSPRHFSVGGDGLVCICPSDVADAKMRMFNLDGSEGKMCGNAIRCVGKYLYDNGICTKNEIKIETLSGIKKLALHTEKGKVKTVTVAMGQASFDPAVIPLAQSTEAIKQPIEVAGQTWEITCASMGNPHAVIICDDVEDLELDKIGPQFENNELFPERVNTEFIKVLNSKHLQMRVWERGSGETFACGTGACASVACCVKNGICPANENISVDLIGGRLTIICDKDFNITMTGPAEKVYEGVYDYED